MSLEPAAAALAGFVVVGEVLEPPQLVAIGVRRRGERRRDPVRSSTLAEPRPD